jgi:hypothetical protein
MAAVCPETRLEMYSPQVGLYLDGDQDLALVRPRHRLRHHDGALAVDPVVSEAALVDGAVGEADGASALAQALLEGALVLLPAGEDADTLAVLKEHNE